MGNGKMSTCPNEKIFRFNGKKVSNQVSNKYVFVSLKSHCFSSQMPRTLDQAQFLDFFLRRPALPSPGKKC